MAYADFVNSDGYQSKASGAGMAIQILDIDAPESPLVGATNGINFTENTPSSAVEEAGADGVDEFVDERHTGQGTFSYFYTAERNDRMPTRSDFIGRDYAIIESIAPGRPGEGNVVQYFEGVKITGWSLQHGARGLITCNGSFTYANRLNGQQYADRFGA